jgi:hypothetical protein
VPIRPELGSWPVALSYSLGPRAGSVGTGGAISDPSQEQTTTGGKVGAVVDVAGETGDQVAQSLEAYPSFTGAAPLTRDTVAERFADPTEPVTRRSPQHGAPGVTIAKDAPALMSLTERWQLEDSLFSVVEVDQHLQTWPGPTYVGYALPAVAGGKSPLPLLLWWALLLGLSSLARYEPDDWTAAIDLDASLGAAALRAVLDIAAERVPARILSSLTAT